MNRAVDWMVLLPEMVLCGGGVLILLLDAIAPALRRALHRASRSPRPSPRPGRSTGSRPATRRPTRPRPSAACIETSPLTAALLVRRPARRPALCLLASQGYLRRERILSGEYHALLLWCATGLLLMLRATELLTVFLALELLSLCLYSLAAYHRRVAVAARRRSSTS